jgi:phospholipase C
MSLPNDRRTLFLGLALILAGTLAAATLLPWVLKPAVDRTGPPLVPGVTPIERVVVIMKENHAFDNYFGTFPGADGIPENVTVPDGAGGVLRPHWLNATSTLDIPHSREAMIQSYDAGRNDLFGVVANAAGPGLGNVSMGYYDSRQLPGYWSLARNFTLADQYFSSMLGPTYPNRLYSIAGQAGGVTTNPLPGSGVDVPTIFDQLEGRGISWRYYGITNEIETTFALQVPHIASNPSMASKVVHLAYLAPDIASGNFPSVTYIDPNGFLPASIKISEHPPGDVTFGDAWTAGIIDSIMASAMWPSCVVLVTWDESGGFYDHVPPPQVDEWGYGFRVPTLVISPFVRRGWIDHTVMDHTSILKFIADNWGLPYLTSRQARAGNLTGAFVFGARGTAAMTSSLGAPILPIGSATAPLEVAVRPPASRLGASPGAEAILRKGHKAGP